MILFVVGVNSAGESLHNLETVKRRKGARLPPIDLGEDLDVERGDLFWHASKGEEL